MESDCSWQGGAIAMMLEKGLRSYRIGFASAGFVLGCLDRPGNVVET
jgi:hypothetical protein